MGEQSDWSNGGPGMRLSALVKCLPGMTTWSGPDPVVCAVVDHNARARPGALFVAVTGHTRDGHVYAHEAARRGAVGVVSTRPLDLPPEVPQILVKDSRRALAALCNTFYRQPSRDLQVVGVTGTNGKTTTCYLLRSIFEAAGRRTGYLGTVLYNTGRRILPAPNTTPGPADLHALLSEMRDAGLHCAVMEVSSHALMQHRTDFIHFAAGVFTNLSEEHLDYHGTITKYRNAKGRLFRQLGARAFAIINADDRHSAYFREHTAAQVVLYGFAREASVRAEDCAVTLDGSRFRLIAPQGAVAVDSPLPGLHNVHNSLAAAATALALDCSLQAVKAGLEHPEPVPGRLEKVCCGQPFHVFVDYAHTPQALEAVLRALRPLVRGALIVVFGAGGDRDQLKRPKMGAVVERYADAVWITNDNPRSEDPMAIIRAIRAGMVQTAKIRVEADRREAIAQALGYARAGDLVLIAGKGHETQQIFADRVIEFDDRKVAREILGARWSGAPTAVSPA